MHASRAILLATVLALVALPLAGASGGHDGAEPAGELAANEHAGGEDPGVRSMDLAPGQSWSHTFTAEGRFDYHCHPHPWMLAGISVVASSGRAPRNYTIEIMEPTGQDFEKWTFSPALTTIEVGDTVTWLNAGTVTHVVQETTAEHLEHVGTLAGAAADEHGAQPASVEGGDHATNLGFPTQGWLWVGLALVGGLFIGRRTTRFASRMAATPVPAGALPSGGMAAASANAPDTTPQLTSHARRRDKRNRRR